MVTVDLLLHVCATRQREDRSSRADGAAAGPATKRNVVFGSDDSLLQKNQIKRPAAEQECFENVCALCREVGEDGLPPPSQRCVRIWNRTDTRLVVLAFTRAFQLQKLQ